MQHTLLKTGLEILAVAAAMTFLALMQPADVRHSSENQNAASLIVSQ